MSGVNRREVLAGAAAMAVAGSAASTVARGAAAEPVVETTAGKVRGQRGVAGGYSFFCVPYGASTAGEGRFMPPRAVAYPFLGEE